jgi:Glycine/D-amino acid oxidases (deaminating)
MSRPWPGSSCPVESHILQAFVSEPIKPLVHHVVSFGAELFYLSQSDKGGLVFGGHIDGFNTYTQRGQFPKVQTVAECAVAVMPCVSRLRLLRHWGGIMDMTPDGSPFIGRTPDPQSLYQRRLVLSGLQGRARRGLDLGPYHGQGRGA